MLLTYVDESYCEQCYFVTALVCPDHQALPLADALDAVVRAACDRFAQVPPEAELHGYELAHGRADWQAMGPLLRARLKIYAEAIEAVAAHDVKLIIRGVDSIRLKERSRDNAFDPHSVALTHVLERVDAYAESRGELALIIADEPGQADQQPQYRADLLRYRRDGTWGAHGRKITNIVDTLHFAPSRASRLLQAADLVAYLHHRIETAQSGMLDSRALRAAKQMWLPVVPRVVDSGRWTP